MLRSGQLSLGPMLGEFERAFAARVGAAHGVAVSSGTAGLHLALRAVGVTDGDEVDHLPVLVRGLGQRRAVRAGAPGVRRHRSGDAERRSGRRSPRRSLRGRPRCCPSTCSAIPADMDALEAAGAADRRGRLRGAGRHVRRRRRRGRARASGGVRLLRQQAAHHRRGRHRHHSGRGDQGATGLRAQSGPRTQHGLARPRPPGVQLPAVRTRLRAGRGPAGAPGRHAGRPRPGGRALPRGSGRDRGPRAAMPGRRRQPTGLVRVRRPAPARSRPRRRRPRAGRAVDPEQALFPGDSPDVVLPRIASAIARASSPSARTSRRDRSRCRSSRR